MPSIFKIMPFTMLYEKKNLTKDLTKMSCLSDTFELDLGKTKLRGKISTKKDIEE
jgi:hypothetical protein